MKKYDKFVDGRWLLTESKITTRGGSLWTNMRSRCKSGGAKQASSPSYVGTTTAFEDFQLFMAWATAQRGYDKGWQLDKDLLVKGNKHYSESHCVFLPAEINVFLANARALRGSLPVGVGWYPRNRKFRATVSSYASRRCLGYFDTAEEAFAAYKFAKECAAKVLAEKWKGQLDPRAYEALINYTVSITD